MAQSAPGKLRQAVDRFEHKWQKGVTVAAVMVEFRGIEPLTVGSQARTVPHQREPHAVTTIETADRPLTQCCGWPVLFLPNMPKGV